MLHVRAAQISRMAESGAEGERASCVLEMEAAWRQFSGAWEGRFVRDLDERDRRDFFEQIYEWGVAAPLEERAHVVSAGVLAFRAAREGWADEEIRAALRLVRDGGDPRTMLEWLEYVISERRGPEAAA